MRIVRETLTIDLTALASQKGLAKILAVYELEDQGPAGAATFEYISLGLANRVTVRFDGQEIVGRATDPAAGASPARLEMLEAAKKTSAPRLPGGMTGGFFGAVAVPSGYVFQVVSAVGKHRLEVMSEVDVARFETPRNVAVSRPFFYFLQPAAEWAGFGGLDLKVLLPPRWVAATNPPLSRDGDVLTGSFKEIPAKVLGINAAPDDRYRLTDGVVNLILTAAMIVALYNLRLYRGFKGFLVGSLWLILVRLACIPITAVFMGNFGNVATAYWRSLFDPTFHIMQLVLFLILGLMMQVGLAAWRWIRG